VGEAMRIDMGTASYNNPEKLNMMLTNMRQNSISDWRFLVVDNASTDPGVREVIERHASEDSRIIPRFLDNNSGYVGAVNQILEWAETDYVGYLDNDAYVITNGWDEKLAGYLATNLEVAMAFPNGGAYQIPRPKYTEILWGVGFCWMLKKQAYLRIGGFDTEIGHQEEVDYQTRLRLDGWKMIADPSIHVRHDSTSSNDPASKNRINEGVVNWVNKWNKHYVGPNVTYHSPNVTRFEDWSAIYLEEWYQSQPELKGLNENPETVYIAALGREVDLIKVPRWTNFYRGRII
jgi:GT2 family glycosyltransferase